METHLEEKFGACFLDDGDRGLISDEEMELMPFPRSYNNNKKVRSQISTFALFISKNYTPYHSLAVLR